MNLRRLIVLFFLTIFILSKPMAWGGTTNLKPRHPYVVDREANMLKIVSFLENRVSDQELLKEARNKLATLNETQTKLIASLSDRIANQENATGGDVAFLLIVALIVLS